MEINQFEFQKDKIASRLRISKEFINDLNVKVGQEQGFDYIAETLTVTLEAHLMTRLESVQTITVESKRPTFWQWLTRKRITQTVTVECKELFKNPPKVQGNSFIYTIAEL